MTSSSVCPTDPIRDCKNPAQIVRRVTPLRCQPAVIVVKPPNSSANVESAIDRVEYVRSSRDAGTVWDDSVGDGGAKEFSALGEAEGFEAATEGIEEDVAGGFELERDESVIGLWKDSRGRTARSELIL